jgi:hypothetical protein
MRHIFLLLLGSTQLLFIFLVGCGQNDSSTAGSISATPSMARVEVTNTPEPDPIQLLTIAETKLEQSDTLAFSQSFSTAFGELVDGVEQSCAWQEPGQLYCLTEETAAALGAVSQVPVEFLRQGNGAWMRQGGSWWQSESPEQEAALVPGPIRFTEAGLLDVSISDYIQNAESTVEGNLNGAAVYEIVYSLDAERYYLAVMPGDEALNMNLVESFDDLTVTATVWIGINDSLIHQSHVEMVSVTNGEAITVTNQIQFETYNQPVTIPNPEQNE